MPQIQNMRQAVVNASTIGSNAIIAAPGSAGSNVNGTGFGSITVWQISLEGAGANILQFQSGSTNIGGPVTFIAAGNTEIVPYTGAPWIKCAAGQALNLVLTATAAVTGTIYYTLG